MRYGNIPGVSPLEHGSMLRRIIEREERKAARTIFKEYLPTLKALKGNREGLTAQEVSLITGRAVESEQCYLARLERATIAEKNGDAYVLKNKKLIARAWGSDALKKLECNG